MLTLLALAVSHATLKIFGFTQKISNLTVCTTFQIFFLMNCHSLMFNEIYTGQSDVENTVNNIQLLKEYFIYDTMYLIFYRRDIVFMVHHVLSLIIIQVAYMQDIHSTFVYNFVLWLLESTSPLINLRSIIKINNWDEVYSGLVGEMILVIYSINRIVVFPLVLIYIGFVYTIEYFFIYTVCFSIIYGASVVWFIEMNHKF